VLGLGEEETIVCGMALGVADPDAPENMLATSRMQARSFMRFAGFGSWQDSIDSDPQI
jgi:hypothetical protein